MKFTDFTKEEQQAILKRAKKIMYKVMDRCYNPNFKQYKNYGGAGVTVDDRWKNDYNKFAEDVVELPGFDYELFINGKLELDKDTLYKGNKVYSKDTCVLLTRKENMQYRPSVHSREFYAYNQYTEEIKEHFSRKLFAEENGLNPTVVSAVLNKRKHRAGDWYLWYKDEPAPTVYRIYARKDGEEVWEINPERLSKALGFHNKAVSQAMRRHKNKKLYGWELTKELVDIESLVKEYEANRNA